MKREDKELLLRDLCARLPYGIYGNYLNSDGSLSDDKLLRRVKIGYHDLICANGRDGMVLDGFLKPYLFPLLSMTEEQKREYNSLRDFVPTYHYEYGDIVEDTELYDNWGSIDYLNAHHFDYRGLIDKELAIDCTNLNIY